MNAAREQTAGGDASATPDSNRPTAVYLYATCLIDLFVPQAGLDAVRLLEREGLRVVFPEGQTCCGKPAYSSGHPEELRAVARAQLDLFPEPWPIVVPSGSCAGMFRHQYPQLFASDPALAAKAQDISARVYELTEFLVDVLGFSRPDVGEPCKVALHTSCNARIETDALAAGRALLGGLTNVSLLIHNHESECCGFGGSFAMHHPAISGAMVGDKVGALKECGAQRVVSADCGCLANIGGHAQKAGVALPTEHLASFLWRRTGGEQ